MGETNNYQRLLNRSIKSLFKDALRISLTSPSRVYFLFRTLKRQKKAAKIRSQWECQGIHVPPFLIISVTNRCNLQCAGCYAQAHRPSPEVEMNGTKLRTILQEAKELGISIILIGGGEPLTRPEILDLIGDFPEIIFPLFTNGLLMDQEIIKKIKNRPQIVPVVSLEGDENFTNRRRGGGTFEQVRKLLKTLTQNKIFFGVSLTINRSNYDLITSEQYLRELIDWGCRLVILVEYVPVREGTKDQVLTIEQRGKIPGLMDEMRAKYSALFIAFPGDEEKFGGCLASGRGFAHINPEGGLEPCPFAPYSDTSLKNLSLKEALQSKFLQTIRENHGELQETKGGCALWEKRQWVNSLIQSSTNTLTDFNHEEPEG